MSKHALLYTEMVTTGALLHGERARFLEFNREEHPVALQLGGSDPDELATCAKWAEEHGYDEVNLNCGCPSDRVQSGRFGACLMAEPQLVADCIKAMQDSCSIPVTVKHRIGIDDLDSYDHLSHFVDTIAATGCITFIVHARKAWLSGLSPKQNREVPPLMYERVYQLKKDFPSLQIIINGGINNLVQARAHLERIDGVMVGREAYQNPALLLDVDRQLFASELSPPTRHQVLHAYADYCAREIEKGNRLHNMARHALGLFHGLPGGKRYRRYISENAPRSPKDASVLLRAGELVEKTGDERRQM